ncbi:MAG: LamG domain-containing protein, partial [Planctomycetes bacterium]|nr:LamG domain-containing protein [Planctomycetota bacterium]
MRRHILLFVFCLFLSCPVAADDVMLYLPFDADATPARARGNPEPKVSGKVVLRDGLVGKAMLFGKAGGSLTFDGPGNVDASRGSVAFWVKPVDWDSKDSKSHNFFGIHSDHPKCLMYIYKYFKPDTLNVWMRIDPDDPRGSSYRMPGNFGREPPVVFQKGEWKHIAVTWFNDQLRVYLDGKLRRHWPTAQPIDSGTLGTHITIGASHDPASTLIDELYLFHHPLSDAEIASLYQAGKSGKALPTAPDVPFRVYLKHFPEAGYVEALVDAAERGRPGRVGRAVVTLESAKGEVTEFKNDMGMARIKLPKLPAGEYVATAEFFDAEGKSLGKGRSAPLEIKHYPWMDDPNAGVTGEVIQPWTPVEVEDNVVRCWGREHAFGASALPEQIASAGKDLLAKPLSLVAKIDGEVGEWRITPRVQVTKQTPSRVYLQGRAECDKAKIEIEAMLEFDGLIDFDIIVTPK